MCPKKQLLGEIRMSERSEGLGTGGSSRTTGTVCVPGATSEGAEGQLSVCIFPSSGVCVGVSVIH